MGGPNFALLTFLVRVAKQCQRSRNRELDTAKCCIVQHLPTSPEQNRRTFVTWSLQTAIRRVLDSWCPQRLLEERMISIVTDFRAAVVK